MYFRSMEYIVEYIVDIWWKFRFIKLYLLMCTLHVRILIFMLFTELNCDTSN